jgi:hypothetical protein
VLARLWPRLLSHLQHSERLPFIDCVTELKMRERTVRVMIVLVWFEVLWASIFLDAPTVPEVVAILDYDAGGRSELLTKVNEASDVAGNSFNRIAIWTTSKGKVRNGGYGAWSPNKRFFVIDERVWDVRAEPSSRRSRNPNASIFLCSLELKA